MKLNINSILGLIGLIGLVSSCFDSNPMVRVVAYIGLILNGWCWK